MTVLPASERLLNRELSWLVFDRLVLALAVEPDIPLEESEARVPLAATGAA